MGVPKRVQVLSLHVLPVVTKGCLPLLRKALVLGHDVLDRVVLDRDVLLAPMVLEHAKEVRTAAEVVQVAGLERCDEFAVGRKSAVALESYEVSLDAFDVPVLADCGTKPAKVLFNEFVGMRQTALRKM